jgi:nitrite reductase/ring-hydroxylating ferredoxin subunit
MPSSRQLTVLSERSPENCEGCTRTSRRGFLGQISTAALAAALASELAGSGVEALPVTELAGAGAGGDERTYPLPAADGVTIDRDAQVILVRHQNRVYAFSLACPHENTALRWRQQDVRFQCPRHGSKYQPDGTFISGRATRNMDRFAVRGAGDTIVVDLNQWFRSDQQPAEWKAAAIEL